MSSLNTWKNSSVSRIKQKEKESQEFEKRKSYFNYNNGDRDHSLGGKAKEFRKLFATD
jgi:hypothetical protein